MIPILYDKTGVNRIGLLSDCIKCEVLEERNGEFELTLIYPSNSELLEGLDKENIIISDANDFLKNQKFRIYNTRKLMSNRIEVRARHISFDLAHDWIDTISIDNQPCEYVLNTIFRNSQHSTHYRGYSDIVMSANYNMNKANCIEAIGGKTGSILDTFGNGAEILRDNTDIHILNNRGHDNEVSIEYRKNLTGLTVEEDTTDLVTRIRPYAVVTDNDGNEVETMGNFVDSPLINNYAHPYVKYIDYSSEFDDENTPTVAKLHSLAVKEYEVNKIDIPKLNYKIEFVPLSKCAGYEGLEDRINLCDTVTIRDTRYNIDTQAKVIKVVYNVLRNRYDKMELGEPRTTLGDVIGGSNSAVQGPPGPPGPQGPAGADGSIGDFPNTLPPTPVITTKLYGFASIELSWTFENKTYYSYELYASKTANFTPNTFNLLFAGQASTFLHQVKPKETWYYRVCAVNTHGQRTEFSEQCTVNTVKIEDLSDYVESASIGDALIGTLSLDRGWVGQLKGNWIDAKQLSVTDGNGKRTLDIDSFGNVSLDVANLSINSSSVVTNDNLSSTLGGYPTKTEMNSAINQKANEITSTVELTKRAGVELLPQSLKINSTSGFFAIQGSLKCDYWGLFTGERSWWRSEAIQVDTSQPFYYRFEYECNGGYSPQIYIGLEQWRTPSESMGEDDRTVYVVTGTKTTGWQCAEGTIDASNFESDTRYIRLRVLVNWDNSPMARFTIFNMSLKQLRDMNSSTQIAQMSDKIESKVDVNGVKSTITQSAYEVNYAFNEYSRWDGSSGTSGRILFNANGIHTQASDGSYSTLGSGQVEHYIAGANYKYHSLTHVETIVSASQWCVIDGTYYVPERFRNKNFNVVATVSHVAFDRNVGDAYKNLNISVTNINPANCSYRLHCTPIGVNIGGQHTVNASRLEVVVTVIA